MKEIRVGIIEDQALVLRNLSSYLKKIPNFKICLEASSIEDFLQEANESLQIDIILLDINLPGVNGIVGIESIQRFSEDIDIVMLTSHEESDYIFKALRAGAVGYISKKSSLAQIRQAIESIFNGGSYMSPTIARKVIGHFTPKPTLSQNENILTKRQHQIVETLSEGLSYKLIASHLDISVETVRDHIKKIYKKLNVNSKAEVISKKLKGEI